MRNIKNYLIKLTGLAFIGLLLFVSCKKKKTEPQTVSFNKKEMLTNVADQLIIPSLNDYSVKLNNLKSSFDLFASNITQASLIEVQEKWKTVYLQWQHAKIYDVGPMKNMGFKAATATYPTDTVKIENNIAAGTYNLSTAANADAIGLPSLDYLLFTSNALTNFQTNPEYVNYTSAVLQKMVNETTTLISSWASYRSEFINADGTESTSAFSQLVNEFTRDFELGKNAKLGIPLGKQSLGIAMPEYMEARRSKISLDLLEESMKALKIAFNGASGKGFDDYLVHLDKQTLSNSINNKFDEINNALANIDADFETAISTENNELNATYSIIQSQVVYIKTDMPSAFGVLITYQDNDGD